MSDDASDNSGTDHPRHVRSFVLRAGRLTHAQERALEVLWPVYGIDFSTTPLDFDVIFQRHAPRLLEIGFGAGEALLAFAGNHPDYDCIGIEVHPPGVGHLLLGVEREQLANVRVIAHDAVEVLAQTLAPRSIDLIHIFFPDPWPKKRHHKRRLIQPAFVRLLERVLSLQGEVRLATDWEHYAFQMREVFERDESFINVHGANTFAPRTDARPLTRFERRGQRLGHDVWDLHYRRHVAIG
ncbi:MAG: tRNA (guanosine(46)-N7)-methyltransferase TrmB [Steroidobacteraceae bacterium]